MYSQISHLQEDCNISSLLVCLVLHNIIINQMLAISHASEKSSCSYQKLFLNQQITENVIPMQLANDTKEVNQDKLVYVFRTSIRG